MSNKGYINYIYMKREEEKKKEMFSHVPFYNCILYAMCVQTIRF